MRETTDGFAQSNCATSPLWMALITVYPVVRRVNSFLRGSMGRGPGGRWGAEVSGKLFIINDICLLGAQCWERSGSLRAQDWLMGALVEPGWLRAPWREQVIFPTVAGGQRTGVGERPSGAKARVLFERRPRVGLRPSPQEKHGVSEQRSTFKIQIFKANHGLSLPCGDRALGLGQRHSSVTPNHCGGACGTRWPWRAWQGQLLGGFEAGDAWGHFEDSVVGSGPETYRSMARSSRCSRLADSQPWPRIWRVVLCASEQILSPDFLPRLRGRFRKWGTKD
jgi:hypothetical protein